MPGDVGHTAAGPKRAPSGRRQRRVGRGGALVALLVGGVIVVAACNPITVDYQTGQVTAESAQYQVVPTTVTVAGQPVDAIDIQIQFCNQVHYTNWTNDTPIAQDYSLHPYVGVEGANGQGYATTDNPDAVKPAGFRETDSAMGSSALSHVIVPVSNFTAPLSINVSCENNESPPAQVHLGFTLPGCVTTDRTCAVTKGGTFDFQPY